MKIIISKWNINEICGTGHRFIFKLFLLFAQYEGDQISKYLGTNV